MNAWLKLISLSCFFYIFLAQSAIAGGITVGGTRLIYDGGKKEASLSVTNSDTNPYLIQSWAEAQQNSAGKAPFIITPPLFRLEPGRQNILRVVYVGGVLPEDRESLFWLNVKSIPAGSKSEGTNTLQIAVKTSIKLIYRPKGLKGAPEGMTDKLSWSVGNNQLTVNNPTPFYMNFRYVKVGGHEVKDATYVAPLSSATFALSQGSSGQISWKIINDYGGVGSEHLTKR